MTSDPSVYDASRSKHNSKNKDLPSTASNLAFNSTLSSLLASASPKPSTTNVRSRPSTSANEDIFKNHNRRTKKRALANTPDDGPRPQKHAETSEAVDAATLQRSKRKMEEKARLYASMKRGDYVPPNDGRANKEAEALVDFDRKWAEQDERKNGDTSSDDYDDDEGRNDAEQEMVEYEDEFGRMRRGTKAEATKMLRQRNAAAFAQEELSSFSARPERPVNLIVGDAIQSAAFNPDEPIAAQMETLARKRDRSVTPPEEVHYDATKEVRSKGVGFYQFSKDAEGRKKEMEALGKEREETERLKKEREERKKKKKKEMEDRKRLIGEKRGKKLADQFLAGLNEEIAQDGPNLA
ncbi:MAG: hypothetical protein Q9217_001035 [Psora testacea]